MTRCLFIDDHHVSRIVGLKRTMHAVDKHPGNPVIRKDRAWEGPESVWLRHGAHYDARQRLFRTWYNTNDFGGRAGYAASPDGVHWDKPNLGLVEFEGSTENNIVASDGRLWQVVNDDAPPGPFPEGTRHLGISWTAQKGQFIQSSADGLHWNGDRKAQLHGGDALSAVKAIDCLTGPDPDLPAYPVWNGQPRYVASNRWCVPVGDFDGSSELKPARRVLMLYQSNDLLNWEKPLRIITPDERDDQMAPQRIEAALADGSLVVSCREDWRSETYDMLIVPYEDMYIGLLSIFDPAFEFRRIGGMNQAGPMEVQLAASRDLVDWQRLGDRQPFIPRGGRGEFDTGLTIFVTLPIVKDGKLWFYYTGTAQHHGARASADKGADRKLTEHYQTLRRRIATGELPGLDAIGLATLRRDGFVSLDAGREPGYVLTRPFVWPQRGALHLNVDARGGEVRVAVCQPDGSPYLGYEQSDPVTGDQLDAAVAWPRGSGEPAPGLETLITHETAAEAGTAGNNDYEKSRRLGPGKMARLKIMAQNASLYSYWFA